MPVGNDRFGKISVHRGRANADEYGEIMRVQAFGRTDIDRRITAQAIADQMRVHSRRREDHRDTDAVGADILVGQEQFGFAHPHCGHRFFANTRNGGAQALLPVGNVISAINLGAQWPERGLQPAPIARRQDWAIQNQDIGILALFFQDIGEVRKTRFQAHHMPFAQAVDRRVGDLAEILAEELANQAGFIADDGQRGVVAHRPNSFLAIFDHRREDHFDIFQCHASGDLTLRQFRARPSGRAVVASLGQVGDAAEAADQCAIILLGRNAVF